MTTFKNNGHGRTAFMALGAIVVIGVAVLWAWNTVATEMFGLAKLQFRHVIALEILTLSAGILLSIPTWLGRSRQG